MTQCIDNKIVKTGMATGLTISVLYVTILYCVLSRYIQLEATIINRIILVVKCTITPCFMLFLGVLVMGASRYGNASQDPTTCEALNRKMNINLHYLKNTQEQLMLFVINMCAFSTYLDDYLLLLLPIYSSLFVIGRIVFWIGYHYHPLYRATGFGMTFYPSIIGMIYSMYKLLVELIIYIL